VNADWHFPIMIIASLIVFITIVRIVLPGEAFSSKKLIIFWLSFVVVVMGMLLARYAAQWNVPWWIYYPVPMLLTVFLPPLILRLDKRRTLAYLILSFVSAPIIHVFFSLVLGWPEYLPFWRIN
jgi:hypothetical protein